MANKKYFGLCKHCDNKSTLINWNYNTKNVMGIDYPNNFHELGSTKSVGDTYSCPACGENSIDKDIELT